MLDFAMMVFPCVLAVIMREKYVYIIAGFSVLAYGFMDIFGFDSTTYRVLLLAVLGLYLIIRGLLNPKGG